MLQSSNKSPDSLQQGLKKIALQNYKAVHSDALDMLRSNAANPVPYCLLGVIAAEHGNHRKACELLHRAVELEPENANYQAYHGKELTILGRQNEAKSAADKAAKFPIGDAFLADTIGVIYSRTGFHEKAVHFFAKAVALDSAPANFHYNLAASQQFLGELSAAESAYHQTLKRDRKTYRAWSSIVGLKRQTEDDNNLDTLLALFEEMSEDEDAALHLGHAIAKTLEDLGRYEESLEWLHKAKAKKRQCAITETDRYPDLFRAAKRTASSGSKTAENCGIAAPIFIIGLPRTGTTLVDRILSSHSRVTSAGELNFFPALVKDATGTRSNMMLDVATLDSSANLNMAAIGHAYIDRTKDLARGADRFTDKMPLNFFYAGLIHRALPNARIVTLRRGAMDSCLSNYRQLLTVQQSYYQYTYDLTETARFYRRYDDLIATFRSCIPANRFMEIRYEDIVYQQEEQTRRLLDFCDLEWEENCLDFHNNSAPVATASSIQVRQPLYSGSIGRWQRYGDKLNDLRRELGPLADAETR